MLERERKYKLLYLPKVIKVKSVIKQGYLMFEGSKHLRVRLINDQIGYLTYKNVLNETDREEYEFEIEYLSALELFDKSEFKLIKTRYVVEHEGKDFEIDFLPNGKEVVEIEYGDNGIGNLPDFCGEDVTNDKEYSNIYIAKTYKNGKRNR